MGYPRFLNSESRRRVTEHTISGGIVALPGVPGFCLRPTLTTPNALPQTSSGSIAGNPRCWRTCMAFQRSIGCAVIRSCMSGSSVSKSGAISPASSRR